MGNNRFVSRPAKFPGQPIVPDNKSPNIAVKDFMGGMNTHDDANDIPDNTFQFAKNVFLANTRVWRRYGTSNISPTKPNSDPVRNLVSLQEYDGTISQLRFTDADIYRRSSGSWTQITDAGASPFTVFPNNVVSVDNRHFFSTQGETVIQEIDLGTNTYVELGNSVEYRYITSFGDRIIGAYLDGGSPNPVQVGWSGNLNYDEWDPLTDPSAGSVPLVDSQNDYADFITGVFGFSTQLLVLKERSIWLANKTGSNTAPFYFFVSSPNFGCDTPRSVQRVPNGIMYYDRRTNNVYYMNVNQSEVSIPMPTPVGTNVQDFIFESIDDPADVFSSFDPIELRYSLAVPLAGSDLVRVFVYSFKTQSWWYDEREDITCISSLNYSAPTVLIQDLVGTIGGLAGTIGGLSGYVIPTPTTFFGRSDGDIEEINVEENTGYPTTLISKNWTAEDNNDLFIQRLTFTYEPLSEGSMTIYYSKDNSLSWTPYKSVTFAAQDSGKRLIVNCVKSVKARQFTWKIESIEGVWSLVDFKALVYPSGYSRT